MSSEEMAEETIEEPRDGGLTDAELPGYAELHCRTERALFHTRDIARLLAMAGKPVSDEMKNANTFIAVHEDQMLPLLRDIRMRRDGQQVLPMNLDPKR